MRSPVYALLLALGLVPAVPGLMAAQAVATDPPVFKSGVERVTLAAVVRDRRGRMVTNLQRDDFELIDAGQQRPITDFRTDNAPVTIALLFDVSGSMEVGGKHQEARQAADQVLAWLQPGRDETALFAFDSRLRQLQDFTRREVDLGVSLADATPFGVTALHDAIAETATRLATRGGSHRAVVALTDGADNNSRLTPSQVSGVASAIDVPVYIIVVVSPLDHPGRSGAVEGAAEISRAGALGNLARWTGGELFIASRPADASVAARQIVADTAGHSAADAHAAADTAAAKADAVDKASKRLIYEVTLSEDEGGFKFGNAALPPEARAKIDEIATKLKENPNGASIEIEGHTDNLGPKAYNEKLGLERAESVERYLYERHRIPLHKMSVISYGADKPVAPNTTKAGRAQNRRVVVKVLT